ncbi:MAG: IclR family transcriptional regulator [Treponema sp.]|nr:IclR family transcriptional regulator [Treponema sp.]
MEILSILGSSQTVEFGITDIAFRMGLNKSTVFGLVSTLQKRGYVEQNRETKRYRLGIKLFEMGSLVQRRMDVRTEAKPYCQELSEKYSCTVHVAAFYDFEVVYIDKVDSPDVVVQYSQLGRRAPMYCTGVGKAILANLSLEERELFYKKVVMQKYTAKTITTRENLEKELQTIHKCGYAVDDEEIQPGLRCVAAPIFNHQGHPLAAISVSKLLSRITSETQSLIAGDIVGITRQISYKLGYKIG